MNQALSMTRQAPRRNELLAALPGADYERLAGSLELVRLPLGWAVYEPGGRLDHVYFPTDCIVSLLSVTHDGSSAEIAVAGNEGLVGIASFMGGLTTSGRAVVQNAGHAYRAPVAVIQREFERGGALQQQLLRYTQGLITQMSQTAICNRHHTLEQQLCRWLLLSLDRLPSNRLDMTEALVAGMLGVPPEGVAGAVRMLQTDGLIRYRDGAISVLDRPGVEQRACECYAAVRREVGRLQLLPGRVEALRLSAFISSNVHELAAPWQGFEGILAAIAQDIQCDGGEAALAGADAAAAAHGALRHGCGFDLKQLGAEFRALRTSVTRLWQAQLPHEHQGALEELARFHDSVDGALAASVAGYTHESERARDTQVAMLAHDLRSPLCAVSMSGHYLSAAGIVQGREQLQAVARIQRGAARMDAMIEDLLEYARTHLGRGLPVVRSACSIGSICEAALEEMKAAHPQRCFRLQTSGGLDGSFDADRLQQAFANLLNNAVQHGARDAPVILAAHGGPEAVSVQVKNAGRPIPAEALGTIFEPLMQAPPAGAPGDRRSSGLGLGLFIARTIVLGHGGTLEVASCGQAGTVFTARFPRCS